MTAEDRFKWMLANALERNCVLEAELEKAQQRIAELEAAQTKPKSPKPTRMKNQARG